MNKRELIRKYEELLKEHSPFHEPVPYTSMVELFLKELKLLDEPQKVKVSEEEAKFLETFDFNCESDVTTALYHVSRVGWGYYLKNNDGIELKDLSEGFRELENRKRLIKAILDGYEVEKEKRYLVKMKGVDSRTNYLYYGVGSKSWLFKTKLIDGLFRKSHTRKELEEAGFGWVFDCPGIEIEEVTE